MDSQEAPEQPEIDMEQDAPPCLLSLPSDLIREVSDRLDLPDKMRLSSVRIQKD